MTPEQVRNQCEEIVREVMPGISGNPKPSVEEQVDTVLCMVAFLLHDISEFELRGLFNEAGIDLTDREQFEAASDYTSWFVGAGAIQLSDCPTFSLLDLDTHLFVRHQRDEEMQERMTKIKFDGMMFREMLASR